MVKVCHGLEFRNAPVFNGRSKELLALYWKWQIYEHCRSLILAYTVNEIIAAIFFSLFHDLKSFERHFTLAKTRIHSLSTVVKSSFYVPRIEYQLVWSPHPWFSISSRFRTSGRCGFTCLFVRRNFFFGSNWKFLLTSLFSSPSIPHWFRSRHNYVHQAFSVFVLLVPIRLVTWSIFTPVLWIRTSSGRRHSTTASRYRRVPGGYVRICTCWFGIRSVVELSSIPATTLWPEWQCTRAVENAGGAFGLVIRFVIGQSSVGDQF